MLAKELRAKSEDELTKMLTKMQQDVKKDVQSVLQGKSKNTAGVKGLRRDVARIKTVLSEKAILADKESK